MTSPDPLINFLTSFERLLEGAFSCVSNPQEFSTKTAEIDAFMQTQFPDIMEQVKVGAISVDAPTRERLAEALKQLEKLQIFAQSRLNWVYTLNNEIADWVEQQTGTGKE